MLIKLDAIEVDVIAERPSAEDVVLTKPTEADLDSLVTLINAYAKRGDLLPRTADSVKESLPDWVIAKVGDTVIACGSLLRYSPVLAEVRSLAVADTAQGLGLGRQIVAQLEIDAQKQKIPTLFALTRVVQFFEKMGFTITEKEYFPQKVWNDCNHCPIQDNCDETAVVKKFSYQEENKEK